MFDIKGSFHEVVKGWKDQMWSYPLYLTFPIENKIKMNKPKYLMLHCSATKEGHDFSEDEIRTWFTSRGWKYPGYRQITHLDGTITILQEYNHNQVLEDLERTNGARGWNHETIHLSYIGGVTSYDHNVPKDTRTPQQLDSLEAQVKFFIYLHPQIQVIGHNQVSSKACPSFDVRVWLESISVPYENIYTHELRAEMMPACMYSKEGLFDLNQYK